MKKQSVDFEVMISKAARLELIRKQLSDLEKEEQVLKDFFKTQMTDKVQQFGDVVVCLIDKTRNSFDTKLFISENGKKAADPYMKQTDFVSVLVNRAE